LPYLILNPFNWLHFEAVNTVFCHENHKVRIIMHFSAIAVDLTPILTPENVNE